MKTKHIVSILSLMLIILLGIYSCKKEQGMNSQPVSFAEKLAADESFEKLNNAMDRFDPQYVSIVYHDTRTPKQIADASIEILKKLAADPNNPTIQKELASFYHFNSFQEFSVYSNNISENVKELDTKFNFTKELTENNKTDEFAKARVLYAKKMYNNLKDKQSGQQNHIAVNATGVNNWEEYTEELVLYFKIVVNNQGLISDNEVGGGGCNGDICCDQKIVCESDARKQLITNLYMFAGGGAIAGAKLGASAGTAVPGIGNVFGGLAGLIAGGGLGTIYSFSVFYADLDICKAKNQLCIDQKKS